MSLMHDFIMKLSKINFAISFLNSNLCHKSVLLGNQPFTIQPTALTLFDTSDCIVVSIPNKKRLQQSVTFVIRLKLIAFAWGLLIESYTS